MSQRNTAIGAGVIVLILAVLAVLAFTQQQEAAQNEAAAVAAAQSAGTAGADAIATANAQATGQSVAEIAQAAAETAQAEAEATRAAAEQAAQDQAATAAAALAEATEQAGIAAEAQAAATEQAEAAAAAQSAATDQAATAQALASQLETEQANLATQQALATEVASTAAFNQEQATASFSTAQAAQSASEADFQATLAAVEDQLGLLEAAATAEADVAATAIAELQTQPDSPPDVALEPTAKPDDPVGDINPPGGTDGDSFEVPDLDESFTNGARTVSLNYPGNWMVVESEDGQIVLATSANALDDALPAGEMRVFINILVLDSAGSLAAEDFLLALTDIFTENNPDLRFSRPEGFRLGTFDAARVFAAPEGYDLEIITYADNGAYLIVEGNCAPGEGADCEATLTAIAKTIEYSP